MSRPSLAPTSLLLGTICSFPGVNRQGRESDHSPPFSAEVKGWVELYLHSPNTPSWCGGAQLKHRGNFTFTLFSDVISVNSSEMCVVWHWGSAADCLAVLYSACRREMKEILKRILFFFFFWPWTGTVTILRRDFRNVHDEITFLLFSPAEI
jgi:hypothetical protein